MQRHMKRHWRPQEDYNTDVFTHTLDLCTDQTQKTQMTDLSSLKRIAMVTRWHKCHTHQTIQSTLLLGTNYTSPAIPIDHNSSPKRATVKKREGDTPSLKFRVNSYKIRDVRGSGYVSTRLLNDQSFTPNEKLRANFKQPTPVLLS